MFGHQDDNSHEPQTTTNDLPVVSSADPVAVTSSDDNSYIATPVTDLSSSSTPLLETEAADGYVAEPTSSPSAPALVEPATVSMPDPMKTDIATPADNADATAADTNGLLDIKQNALQQLSPLVDHLDQSPEEKFRTTMMMIQASDNQALVKTAYEIAGQINDEKARAQALLDIINEINYFTQHNTAS
jgi:hypothetical protein